MLKLALLPVLLAVSCLVAGAYGAAHNQISFTVSPDYFYAFKFHQFRIPQEQQGRLGAAIVGWHASWWMGAVIGIPVLLGGLFLPDAESYFRHCLVAIGVVVLTTLLVGLGALALASATITDPNALPYLFPEGVVDRVAFARAGTMHNFSYLGGGLGIITAAIYLAIARAWLTKSVDDWKSPLESFRVEESLAEQQDSVASDGGNAS